MSWRSFSDGGPTQALTSYGWQASCRADRASALSFSRRIQYLSTDRIHSGPIEQPNRRLERGRTQVHIPLCRHQVLVPSAIQNRDHRQRITRRFMDHEVGVDAPRPSAVDV